MPLTHGGFHGGFSGLRAFAARKKVGGKLISFSFEIPQETLPSIVRLFVFKKKSQDFFMAQIPSAIIFIVLTAIVILFQLVLAIGMSRVSA